MHNKFKLVTTTLLLLGLSLPSIAQKIDPNKLSMQYRQALMTLVGQNFGPMVVMAKGQIHWDSAMFAGFEKDLELVASLKIQRGFREGSGKGKTKAKPEIWKNKADFEKKMQAMTEATAKLSKLAADGNKAMMLAQFKETGGTCKSCHDDFKSKEYLNQ